MRIADLILPLFAVILAAPPPTAKTVYILAGEYRCEEIMVASTVSMTTLVSVISLVIRIYGLSGLGHESLPGEDWVENFPSSCGTSPTVQGHPMHGVG